MVKRFYIGAMTCVNCQNRIESKLKGLPGVKEVHASFRSGAAEIDFDEKSVSFSRIEREIEELGYTVLHDRKADRKNLVRAVGFLTVIIVLYALLQKLGILNLLVPRQLADSSMGYGMLFFIGLLTSVHCIAMCGGINLSQCLPKTAVEESRKKGAAFLPSILYNLGRVVSYTLVGFFLGFIGWLVGGSSGVGVPVKWTINAPSGSINGCNYKMILQEYGIEHVFQEGENIIEFTPTEAGTFSCTCWMGMIKGTVKTV